MILRSLSSSYSGFFSRNRSTKSKKPSDGSPTGTTTLYFAPAEGRALRLDDSASAAERSPNIRHLKGRDLSAGVRSAPKFTRRVMFLKLIVGMKTFPSNCSGIFCGSHARTPSRKREMVLALGLSRSRLRTTPITLSPQGLQTLLGCFKSTPGTRATKNPPWSKFMLPPASPSSTADSARENPTRSALSKCSTPLLSKIFTS
mmetsp:Transcript_57201/g.145269  ORF Transcript_57201/g.145269 Transcript_57201/m.145269 type:complete len:202 (-) Transcript_57201:258-863(-)